MMINRNNYEEFFLMYVDDELTALQRAEVEMFVGQNPDLRNEFEMLQQTKLEVDDSIEFAHKTELLKIKESIDIDNYQEYFLLYIDNELNESSRGAVEKFVLQHPQLQDEFTLLKQTVLSQEKIGFHDKKSLYRKEERRVIYFNWSRIAAAAALVGVTTLIWWIAPHNAKNNTDIATVQQNKQTVPAQNINGNRDTVQHITQPPQNISEQITSAKKIQKHNEVVAKTEKKKTIKPVEDNTPKEANIALKNDKKNDDLTKAAEQTISNNKNDVTDSNPIVANADNGNVKENEDPLEKAKSINAVNTKAPKEIVQPANYKELNTDEDINSNNDLYIGNMELNKNQVRGIMKRIGGLFSGKSKKSTNEKGKLQVANFELNTN